MKRLINAVCITGISAIFILASTYLLQNQLIYYEVSERICGIIRITDQDTIEMCCVLIRHIVTCTPLIWVYYLSVLVPRVHGWKKGTTVLSFSALIIGTFFAVLSVSSIYYDIFSKMVYWEVHPYYSRIPVILLNAAACGVGILLMFFSIYKPSIKKNSDKWVKTDVFIRTCSRYGLTVFLGHLAVWFAAALKSVFLNYRVGNLPDFIMAAEPYSKSLIGLLVLIFAEPLMQELAFRGLMFGHMKKGMTPQLAAVLSSALYVIFYWRTGLSIYIFLLGLLLCSVYQRTERLRFSLFMHMGINIIKVIYIWGGEREFPRLINIGVSLERKLITMVSGNGAMALLSVLVLIVACLYCIKLVHAE